MSPIRIKFFLNDNSTYVDFFTFRRADVGENFNYFYCNNTPRSPYFHYRYLVLNNKSDVIGIRSFLLNPVINLTNIIFHNNGDISFQANVKDWGITNCSYVTKEGIIVSDPVYDFSYFNTLIQYAQLISIIIIFLGGLCYFFGRVIQDNIQFPDNSITSIIGGFFLLQFLISPLIFYLFLDMFYVIPFSFEETLVFTLFFCLLYFIIHKISMDINLFLLNILLFLITLIPIRLFFSSVELFVNNFYYSFIGIIIVFCYLFLLALFYGSNEFQKIDYNIYLKKRKNPLKDELFKITSHYIVLSDGTFIYFSEILKLVPIQKIKRKKVNFIQETFNWIHDNAIWILFYATIFFYLVVIYLLISFLKI